MKDKTILITGSTDGIGKQTALELAGTGARVLLHGKDPERGMKVLKDIKKATGNENLEIFIGDLSSLTKIHDLADDIHQKHDRLHVLLNNAGVFETGRRVTEDGYERTLAVNHLAPFLLTGLLLDLLKKGAPSRIVNVASMIHGSSMDFEKLQGEKGYDAHHAYRLSKFCNILFTYELAERLEGTGVTVNCLHPGVINTKLFKAGWGAGGGSVTSGSRNSNYVATAPELDGVNGKYFVNRREAKSKPITYDADTRRAFWKLSEEMTGLAYLAI